MHVCRMYDACCIPLYKYLCSNMFVMFVSLCVCCVVWRDVMFSCVICSLVYVIYVKSSWVWWFGMLCWYSVVLRFVFCRGMSRDVVWGDVVWCTCGRMDGWVGGWMDGWMDNDGWMYACMHGWCMKSAPIIAGLAMRFRCHELTPCLLTVSLLTQIP